MWNKQTICDRYICLLKADRCQREQQSMVGWKYMRLGRARLVTIVQVTYDNVKDVFDLHRICNLHNCQHTHARLTALFPGLPRWAGTRKVKPIWILLKQETVSGSGISWATCKFAPHSRQITMPAPHHSVFYRPDALPAAQPTASKHWRQPQPPTTELNIFCYQ